MIDMDMISLFSGGGGFDIGFSGGFKALRTTINNDSWIDEEIDNVWVKVKRTKFNPIFANDIMPQAKRLWENYFQEYNTYYLGDIWDVVKNNKNILPNNADLLIGGFPCQTFSVSGKREGINSERGKLYLALKEVVSLTLPKMFIAENVKGLLSLGDSAKIIREDLSNAGDGYLVIPVQSLYAPNYGVPQSRERIFFIGFRKNDLNNKALQELSKDIIPAEYDPYPIERYNKIVTCKDAFVGLLEPEESNDLAQKEYSKCKFLGQHRQGQKEIKLDGVAPTIRSEHHGNVEFRRLSKEHGGIIFEELNEGLKERRLTVRECARVQTFPDDYEFILPKEKDKVAVSPSSAYKIIGNAVPPVLAYNIAKNIEMKWDLYFG